MVCAVQFKIRPPFTDTLLVTTTTKLLNHLKHDAL
jgi:hypothetical protein